MTEAETSKIMGLIAVEFPRQIEVTPERITLWHRLIGHHSYEMAQGAVLELLSKPREWPPNAGEINGHIAKRLNSLQELDWGDEWNHVMSAAANANYNARIGLAKLQPATAAAIGGCAGLKELALATNDQIPTIRAQFRQRFEGAVKRDRESLELIHRREIDNAKRQELGYERPKLEIA